MNNLVLRCTYDGVTYDLDTPNDIDFRVDLSAVENTQIGSVFGVASQQFDLPSSKNNDKFFNLAYSINATGVKGMKNSVDCQVLQGGTEIYKGNLILDEVITDGGADSTYKVTVVNETIDFQTVIQDQYIRDLDFSDYSHDYTMANITGSWETSSFFNGDVFYPLVDYGTDKSDNTIPLLELGGQVGKMDNANIPLKPIQFKPAVRAKTLVDKIFESVGYEYSSSFFDSEDFQKMYVLSSPSDKLGIESQGYQDSGFYVNITSSLNIADSPAYQKQLFPQEQYDPAGGYDLGTSTYIIRTDGQYAFKIEGTLSAPDGTSGPDIKEYTIQIRINGSAQFSQFFDLVGSTFGTYNFVTPGLTLSVGDTVEVFHRYRIFSVGTTPDLTLASSAFSTIYAPTTVVGGDVDLARQFDQSAKSMDYLTGLFEAFNLVVTPKVNERKTLVIEPFDIWRDGGEIKDWTDKFDVATKVSIKHPIQSQPRVLNFSLEEDEDPLNQYSLTNFNRQKVYGTHTFTADTDIAQGERSVGSFFSASPTKGVAGGPNVIIPQLYKKDEGEKNTFKFKPRLMYRIDGRDTIDAKGGKIYVKDDNGVSKAQTSYSTLSILNTLPATPATKALHFNANIWYPFHQNYANGKTMNGLFYEYWGRYINELYDDDARMLTCNLYFEPYELSQINLNDRVFIKDAYYRINKISGFNVSKRASVQVELLKAPVSRFKFKRHRVLNDIGVGVDLVADGFDVFSGNVTYVDINTGTSYTSGSFLENVGRRDGFSSIGGRVEWSPSNNLTLQTERRNQVEGSNNFDASVGFALGSVTSGSFSKDADRIIAIGSGLEIGQASKSTLNVGDNNIIQDKAEYSTLLNTTNAIVYQEAQFATIIGGDTNKVSGSNATIIASNQSSMNNATDAVILAGDSTSILNSDKSVAIGQDLTVIRGNSNIVIGNYDTTTRTVTDMINTVVINPNRNIESIENLGGEDLNGLAYIGSYQDIGARYTDNKTLTMSAGQTLYITSSIYANDSVYNLSWSGGAGSATIYLPSVDDNPAALRDSQGYKRLLRFIADNTLDSTKQIIVNVAAGDSINGQFNGWYTMDSPYEHLEIYGIEDTHWRILSAGTPEVSAGGHEGSFGSFYSTATQTIAVSGSAQLITLNQTGATNNIALSGSGAIQMDYNGSYRLSYTAQLSNLSNSYEYADFWIKYNGADYPYSGVRISAPPRKSASEPSDTPITVTLLDTALNNGDKVELYWKGTSTSLSLKAYTGAGSPNTPSVRAQINAV